MDIGVTAEDCRPFGVVTLVETDVLVRLPIDLIEALVGELRGKGPYGAPRAALILAYVIETGARVSDVQQSPPDGVLRGDWPKYDDDLVVYPGNLRPPDGEWIDAQDGDKLRAAGLGHLAEDAPSGVCSGCGRVLWGPYRGACGMRQPDGHRCKGRIESRDT